MTTTTCKCGRPTRNSAYACDTCADQYARILGDIPWLLDQLEITMTKQRAKNPNAGTSSGDKALPWHDRSARILGDIRHHLAGTVRLCNTHAIRHQSPDDTQPAKNPVAMSRWLLWRVDGLTFHTDFTGLVDQLANLEASAYRTIDRHPDLVFLGPCDFGGTLGLCGGTVYARPGEPTGRCTDCRTDFPVIDRREKLERALDDRLCTASEIAELSTYLGLTVPRERVRKQVNLWHHRGRLAAVGDTDPRFRYGDVRTLLAQTYDTKE